MRASSGSQQGITIALTAYIGWLFYFFDFKCCFVKVPFGKKLSAESNRQKAIGKKQSTKTIGNNAEMATYCFQKPNDDRVSKGIKESDNTHSGLPPKINS